MNQFDFFLLLVGQAKYSYQIANINSDLSANSKPLSGFLGEGQREGFQLYLNL
jgi:hypothetical protein